MVPAESGCGISIVRDLQGLLHEHIQVVIAELELHHFGGEFQTDRIGLGLNEEAEWPVIDVVRDRRVERFDHL